MVPVQFEFWLSIEARAVAMAVVTVAATGVVDVPEIVQVPGVNAPPLPTSPLMVPGPTQVTAVVPTTVKGAAAPRLGATAVCARTGEAPNSRMMIAAQADG